MLIAHRKQGSRAESCPRTEFSQVLTFHRKTTQEKLVVEIGRKGETGQTREGGRELGVKLRERRKEVTEGWREGQLAGRGRSRHLPFLSAVAGLWETITRRC